MMGSLPSSSTISPHYHQVRTEIHSKEMIEYVRRGTWRQYSSMFEDKVGGCD
jgi:UDP-2,3-diacylglucosamine pyrophosphatase LpxH